MREELTLWKIRARYAAHSFGTNIEVRWLISLVVAAALISLMTTFYFAGTYANRYAARFDWVMLGVALTFIVGLLTSLQATTISRNIFFLPISHHAITWYSISLGLRYPVLICFVLIAPFYIGQSALSYYTGTDYFLLVLGLVALLISTYLLSVAVGRAVRHFARHSFIRLVAVVTILVLFLEFVTSSSIVSQALVEVFNSISFSEAVLVALAGLGVAGIAVAAIELDRHRVYPARLKQYWATMSRSRNFRTVFGVGESALVQEVLHFVRSGALHQQLAAALLFFLTFQAILQRTVEHYPGLAVVWHAIFIGFVTYVLAFQAGRRQALLESGSFSLPRHSTHSNLGRLAAVIVIGDLIISLVAQSNPVGTMLGLGVGVVMSVFAFWCGRSVGVETNASYHVIWAIILIGLAIPFLLTLNGLVVIGGLEETLLIFSLWSAAYLALAYMLAGRTRTQHPARLQ